MHTESLHYLIVVIVSIIISIIFIITYLVFPYLEQSSALPMRLLGFCCCPVSKQSASKATGVENPGQKSHFLTPIKISGGVGKISSVIFLCHTYDPTTDIFLIGC